MVIRYCLIIAPIIFFIFIKNAISCPILPSNLKAKPSDLKISLVIPMFLDAGRRTDTKNLPFWIYPKALPDGGKVMAAVGVNLSEARAIRIPPVTLTFLISTHQKCYELKVDSSKALKFWPSLKVSNVRVKETKEFTPQGLHASFHKSLTALSKSTESYDSDLQLLLVTSAGRFSGIAILANSFDGKTLFYKGKKKIISVWEDMDNKNIDEIFWNKIKSSKIMGYGRVGVTFKEGICSSNKVCLMQHSCNGLQSKCGGLAIEGSLGSH